MTPKIAHMASGSTWSDQRFLTHLHPWCIPDCRCLPSKALWRFLLYRVNLLFGCWDQWQGKVILNCDLVQCMALVHPLCSTNKNPADDFDMEGADVSLLEGFLNVFLHCLWIFGRLLVDMVARGYGCPWLNCEVIEVMGRKAACLGLREYFLIPLVCQGDENWVWGVLAFYGGGVHLNRGEIKTICMAVSQACDLTFLSWDLGFMSVHISALFPFPLFPLTLFGTV